MKTLAGRLLLAAILVWSVGSLVVSTSFLWTARGTLGITTNYDGRVSGVVPGSPAAAAGIAAGDRIVLSRTPFESRPALIGAATPIAPGTVVPFAVRHGATVRSVTLTAVELVATPAERVSLLMSVVSSAIFIAVGATLILLRPSIVTWAFGLFCLLSNPVVPALARFPSAAAHLAYVMIYDIVQNAGIVGLFVFAMVFPHTLRLRWRAAFARILPLVFGLLTAWTLWIDLAVCVFAIPVHRYNLALQCAFGLTDAVTIFLVTETYMRGPAQNRPRLRWVLIGFYVGLICNYIGNLLLYTGNLALPGWLDGLLVASAVTLPLTVSYAIVRHRVIEIDVFISRALVYAGFTSLLIVLFGVIDWLFSRALQDFRLSIVFDAFISVGIAVVFDRVHSVLEHAAERIVFRSRHLAAERLSRTAQTFAFINDERPLDDAVVREPYESLNLASAALFHRDGSSYRLCASRGWAQGNLESFDRDDRLALEHQAREGPLHLGEIPWDRDDLPTGAARPVVSIPLRSAIDVNGMLLCSRRRNGEDIDPEELRRLVEFVSRAAVAYDRLDAQAIRRDAEELRAQISTLSARLDEARRENPRYREGSAPA